MISKELREFLERIKNSYCFEGNYDGAEYGIFYSYDDKECEYNEHFKLNDIKQLLTLIKNVQRVKSICNQLHNINATKELTDFCKILLDVLEGKE